MRPLLLATALALLALTAPAAQADTKPPLSHEGRWITGADGRVAVLHGFNMVYKRPPYAPDAIGFGDDDAAFLKAEGFNTVRVGVIYKAVEPEPGVYDDAYLARIEQTVNILARYGINSQIDFHQDLYNERFQGEGFPDWAVQDDGLPAQPQAGFPANYLVMPALQRAFDHFWANDPGPGGVGLQDRYAAAWKHVAARFKDNPWVLGYDLMNEPWPGSTWQQCATPQGCPVFDMLLAAFTERQVKAIREADPKKIIWYEPHVLFNNGADTNLPDFGDENLGMSFHVYCLTANQSGYTEACRTSDSLVFKNANDRAAETGDALLLTEFGATDDLPALHGPLELADEAMMSWQEWHYCGCEDPTTTGSGDKQAVVLDPAKPPVEENVKASTLGALARPYPQDVAGTPEGWSFDPDSKAFSTKWSTKRADGKGAFGADAVTEIMLPKRQYGDGYAADVRGGSIRSAPGAQLLRVSACPGAERVEVRVVPGGGAAQSTCAAPAGKRLKLKLTVKPRRVAARKRVRFRFRVRAAGQPVRGAVVRLGNRRVTTGRAGRATLRLKLHKRGKRRVVARARGYLLDNAHLRVVARRR